MMMANGRRLPVASDATVHIRSGSANGAARVSISDFCLHVLELAGGVEGPPITVREGWTMHRISVVPVLAYLQLSPAGSGRVLGAPVGFSASAPPRIRPEGPYAPFLHYLDTSICA